MEKRELTDDYYRCRNIENLLLMTVLGDDLVREKARAEVQRRRSIHLPEEFEDMFMTNLSVV